MGNISKIAGRYQISDAGFNFFKDFDGKKKNGSNYPKFVAVKTGSSGILNDLLSKIPVIKNLTGNGMLKDLFGMVKQKTDLIIDLDGNNFSKFADWLKTNYDYSSGFTSIGIDFTDEKIGSGKLTYRDMNQAEAELVEFFLNTFKNSSTASEANKIIYNKFWAVGDAEAAKEKAIKKGEEATRLYEKQKAEQDELERQEKEQELILQIAVWSVVSLVIMIATFFIFKTLKKK